MLRNKINDNNTINNSKGGVKMLRNKINSMIKVTILTSLVVSTMLGNAMALETKPDPENYEKTTKYIEKAIRSTQKSINRAKNTLANRDQWSEMAIGSAEVTMEGSVKELLEMKQDLVDNAKRIEFNKKYNLPSYVSRVYDDNNKHTVDKERLQNQLKKESTYVPSSSELTNFNLKFIAVSAIDYNQKNIRIATKRGISSVGLFGNKFEDNNKSATVKDLIIKISEIYGTNNDCMEKILSYDDTVKYPELEDIPDYERRFINFAFDNKLYPRTKQVNLNSTVTNKQAYDLVIAMILK